MKEKNSVLFIEIDPPQALCGAILLEIETEKLRRARLHFLSVSTLAATSLAVIFPVLRYTAEAFSQSGFYQYASLLFFDGGSVLPYWKEFSLTIVESFPLMEITLSLSLVLVLVWSLRTVFNVIFIIRSPKLI